MRYKTEEGKIYDTDKTQKSWEEKKYFNGSNFISVNTREEFVEQTLYLTNKGNYFIEEVSRWDAVEPCIISDCLVDATIWLLKNDHELPEDLEEHRKIALEILENHQE